MKKLGLILVIFFICVGFAGLTSASVMDKASVSITPNGNLLPGQTVSGTMTVSIPKSSTISRIDLYSELDSQIWTGVVNRLDGSLVTEFPAGKRYLDGYTLSGLQEDTVLTIYLDGKVSSNSAGREITVMQATEVTSSGTEVASKSSSKQQVYNPADIPKQIEDLEESITALDEKITTASKLDIDVSQVISKVESARTYLNNAENAGTNNPESASSNIANANKVLAEGDRLLVKVTLDKTKTNLDQVDQILSQLAAKGWTNDEVILLTTTKQGAKNQYDSAKHTYDTTSESNALAESTKTQAHEALIGSSNSLIEANRILEKSNESIFNNAGQFIPYIIIGAVAIIIIAGVVIFLRNRDDDWDELG